MTFEGNVLLAPVPREHIAFAREAAERSGGRVAFGSGTFEGGGRMWEFFDQKVHHGMPVLIHVSSTGTGEYHGATFSHAGIFDRCVMQESEIAELRPRSALEGDRPSQLYWIVRDFRMLEPASFVTFAEAKLQPPLRRPLVKTLKLNL